jgi:hypothetical protein
MHRTWQSRWSPVRGSANRKTHCPGNWIRAFWQIQKNCSLTHPGASLARPQFFFATIITKTNVFLALREASS